MLIKKSNNPNYYSQVIKLPALRKHENADKLQCVAIQGSNVITGLDAKQGDLYIYCVVGSKLNKDFLSWSNQFRHSELNRDTAKVGLFEDNARVKCAKLRGVASNGYIFPARELEGWLKTQKINIDLSDYIGEEFDHIKDICFSEKYEVPVRNVGQSNKQKAGKKGKSIQIEEGQFRFHIDTPKLAKEISHISPWDMIVITFKYHGCSAISSRLLYKRKLTWRDKVAKFFGVKVQQNYYDYVWASRKVIKSENVSPGFYDVDIWGLAHDRVKECLYNGLTIYYEIVGYTPTGKFIQKFKNDKGREVCFDYGCKEKEFDIYIYRITTTNDQGHVLDYSWPQIKAFCNEFGLKHVKEYYYGRASNLLPYHAISDNDEQFQINLDDWRARLLQKLRIDYLGGEEGNEKDCYLCINKVPYEGIVLVKENGKFFEPYKLKAFRFVNMEQKEQDAGEMNLEDNQ